MASPEPDYDPDFDDLFGDDLFGGSPSPLADDHYSSSHAGSPSLQPTPSDVTPVTSLPTLLLPAPPAQVNHYQAPPVGFQLYLPSPPASQPASEGPVPGQLFLPSGGSSFGATSVPPLASVSASPGDAASPESAASPSTGEDGGANGPRKRRKYKPRRNWEREETIRLVKGVEKYGIGAWSRIWADEEFDLSHRTPWDLKDRFRTMWPDEYGGARDVATFFKLDFDAAVRHKKLNRKKTKRKGAGVEGPPAPAPEMPPAPVVLAATTATGRRRVTKRKGTDWSAEEEADLLTAFHRYGRVWRTAAADRGLAFYGRSISDLKDRFAELYPELAGDRPAVPSKPLLVPLDQATAFERGLHNGFGTQGVTRLRAQRISGTVPGPSRPVAPNDGTPGVGGIVHPPAREVGVRPNTYTPEGIVGQDLGFPSPIAALSPILSPAAAEFAAGCRPPTTPTTPIELADLLQLFTPPPPVSELGQIPEAPPVA
ncbi:hypothetical protein TWF481_002397 [Arthrobotrys musiformis]|uniref:Myb-like domain-containing protein n=1 Tax=Arthrobotrys musiformis TaxID=47236 RepID=A0AAV9VVW4_9PEZI